MSETSGPKPEDQGINSIEKNFMDKENIPEEYNPANERMFEDSRLAQNEAKKTKKKIRYLDNGLFLDEEENKIYTPDQLEEIRNKKKTTEELLNSISMKSFKNFYYIDGKKMLPIEGKISPKMLIDYYGLEENHRPSESIISQSNGETMKGFTNLVKAENINSIYIPAVKQNARRVKIVGLVSSPGDYDVPIGTTLQDLYTISNGLLKYADSKSIIFTRNSIKNSERQALEASKKILIDTIFNSAGNSSITGNSASADQLLPLIALASEIEPTGRLTGDLSPGSSLAKTLIIEDGDEIEIIAKRSTVTIAGQVLQPITVSYQNNLSVEDYISLSGGYTQFANRKKVYVIRKDGTSVPVSSRLFRKETSILPGDTIVIPRDLEKLSPIPLVSVASSVISNIAFAAASLNSLRN